MRRALPQFAMLLAFFAGLWSTTSFAQDDPSLAPWQSANISPRGGSVLGGGRGISSLFGSGWGSGRSGGASGGSWPGDGSQYVQGVSHQMTPTADPTVEEADGVVPEEIIPEPEPGETEESMFGGDEDLSIFEPAMDDPVFHEGRDALIREGMWNNRLNNWYASTSVTLLLRQSPAKTVVSRVRELVLNTSGVIVPTFVKVQEARALRFGVEPGMRMTVGRNLFTDLVNRQHSIEFSFVGLNHWRGYSNAIGGPGSSAPTILVFPGLYSGFPLTQGGFNGASLHQLFDSSNMNSFEMNYRVGQLPRPDRIVELPDGRRVRAGTPTLVLSGLAGFRAVTIDEHFLFLSNGVYTTGQPFSGAYKIDTSNNLFGAQIGGDATAQYNIFSFAVRGKAGVYGDAARRSANITITDPVFSNQAAAFRNFTDRASCIADLNFIFTTRLRQNLNFRCSYDFMWCGGLINAPEQQQYTLLGPAEIVNTGRMLFQGVSLGFDATW